MVLNWLGNLGEDTHSLCASVFPTENERVGQGELTQSLQAPILMRVHEQPSLFHTRAWWLGGGRRGEGSCPQEVWVGN